MIDGNGHKEEVQQRIKKCPFLNEWCIGENCALHISLTKAQGGLAQKMELCAFNAMGIILVDINSKTQGKPAPTIQLPHNFRGRG